MKARCKWCGKPFAQSRSALIYCSPKCENVAEHVRSLRDKPSKTTDTEFKPRKNNRFQFTTQADWNKRAHDVVNRLSNGKYAVKAIPNDSN